MINSGSLCMEDKSVYRTEGQVVVYSVSLPIGKSLLGDIINDKSGRSNLWQ